MPIRVVGKSLGCRLIERALAQPGYRGVMRFSLAEAIWLHERAAAEVVRRIRAIAPAAHR